MINLKSVGHFFAKAFEAIKRNEPKVEAGIEKIESTEGVVEAVTAKVPVYGPLAVTVEKLAFAVLGDVANVLKAGDTAGKQKLLDAGLDQKVVDSAVALLADMPQIVAVAQAL